MRCTPLSGGCLIRGAASRPAVLATFPWISFRHRYCRSNKLWAKASAREDLTCSSQSLGVGQVLEHLRKAQGIDRLGQNVEAVVSGRGKHLGIAVSWSLRWTASGCFTEEIRGPQLTFKWGYDGLKDSGCWEVDSSGLVRVMECDDHEAVLMTTYIRTGCWLQPHLQDRFEMELLPSPVLAAGVSSSISGSSSSGSSSSGSGRSGSNGSLGGAACAEGRVARRTAQVAVTEVQGGSCSSRPPLAPPDTAPTATATAAATTSAATTPRSSSGHKASLPTHGPVWHAPASDDVIALGLRIRGRKLRVRVLVRRRDWRLLGFDHRMCADVETWELGEWKEWAEGVQYPSSALHKASNGGQHAYLTDTGAAERVVPLPPLLSPPVAAAAVAADAARAPPLTPSAASLELQRFSITPADVRVASGPAVAEAAAAAAESLQPSPPPQLLLRLPPTDFGMPLLPPLPGDTSYALQGGRQAVPLWRAASGHFLVRPSINGLETGKYFVLDTGASGFVLTPQAAARLGGKSFGETHAAAISGKVAARFIQLGSWSLGGLSIRQPVLMVMALEGLVRGAPGEVVGIVGHDLFRRAIVEVPQLLGGSSPSQGAAEEAGDQGLGFGSTSGSDYGSSSGSDDDDSKMQPWEVAATSSCSNREVTAAAAGAPMSSCYDGSDTAGPTIGPPPSAPSSTQAFEDIRAVPGSGGGAAAEAATTGGGDGSSGMGQVCRSAALGQPLSVAAAAVPLSTATPSLSLAAAAAAASPLPPHASSSTSSLASSASRPETYELVARCAAASSSNNAGSLLESLSAPASLLSRAGSSSSTGCSSTAQEAAGTFSSRNSSSDSGSSSSRSPAQAGASSGRSCSSSSSDRGAGGGGGSVIRVSGGRSSTARAVRRAARTVPYTVHEMVLHHPLEYSNDSDWVWEPLVMIANLPHVHLHFADPAGGPPRSALLMVDSGACGADLMLHARAQKELALAAAAAAQGPAAGGGGGGTGSRSQGHYLRGVGQDPKDFVQLQVLDLPWLEMAGVRFEQVRCMCAAVGGLDISIYSHGILCGDLLARLEWAIDYMHKRIGFRHGAFAPTPRPYR